MEKFETSFLELLRDISEATRRPRLPTYNDLLRDILKKGGVHDTTHADPEVDVEDLEAEKIFGREPALRFILFKCFNPDDERIQFSVIPILGASGIGKTTLARLLYEHESVVKHFAMRVWLKVEGQDFNLRHAAQQILESAMHMTCSIDDLKELDEMVRDALNGRRCLIVFDGVESTPQDVWLHMNNYWFGFVYMGSVVLLTTPSYGVADLVSNVALKLQHLPPGDGGSLFRYAVGSSYMVDDTSWYLEALCGYVPLLLKLVGSMMRCDDNLRVLLYEVHFSNVKALPIFDASVVILLCFWALPPQLRQCLAFCSVFPKGYTLNREKIINMWVAHGLVKPSSKRTLCAIGESYFHQLLCRSFFTDISRNEYGDITEFRVPGVILTILQDVASIVWKGKVGVIGSISKDADEFSLHSEGRKHVRSLIFLSTLYTGATSLDYTFLDFHELQSLDLSCSGIQNLSVDICALRELKCLNLSYTPIEGLPDSFSELSQLQTLDLSWCFHFKVLPKGMGNLACMSHLDLSQCESLSSLPSGIGSLKSLISMPLFVLGNDHDCARLGDLGLLNELRGRLDIRNLENVKQISEANDAKLNQKNLRHLGLHWSKDVDGCFEVLELLEPNRRLKVVDITGYMSTIFPRWISSISSLIKISITDCGCMELPSLGRLPLLKELHLKGMANIQYIGPEFYGVGISDGFPSLEQLGLYDMPTLLQWSGVGYGMFHRLKSLTFEGCPRLQNIPTFRYLPDLICCNSNIEILSSLDQTTFDSLLVKNMGFENLYWWPSLKKLILYSITDNLTNPSLEIKGFSGLQHLSILHCPQFRHIILHHTSSIQRLHVADCPHLESINFNQEATNMTELAVEGCPELLFRVNFRNLHSLSKLTITSSDKFIKAGFLKMLKKLRYLFIRECPLLERELEMEVSPISHIPCVILGNHRVEYLGSNYPDEDTMSALFECEQDFRQEFMFQGSSSSGSTITQRPMVISELEWP